MSVSQEFFNTWDVESKLQNTLPTNVFLGMLTKAKYLYIHQIDQYDKLLQEKDVSYYMQYNFCTTSTQILINVDPRIMTWIK